MGVSLGYENYYFRYLEPGSRSPNAPSDPTHSITTADTETLLTSSELARLREAEAFEQTDFAGQAMLGRAQTSRRTYQSRLNQVAALLGLSVHAPAGASRAERQAAARVAYRSVPWHLVRAHHIKWIKQQLIDAGKSYQTINLTLAALRAVAPEVSLTEHMSGDDLKRIEMIDGVAGKRLPAGRRFQDGEVLAIARACAQDDSAAGVRDEALFALLYAGGLRRREVADLTLADLRTDDDGERAIRLIGKRNKQRWNWPGEGAWRAVDRWLELRREEPGPLFHPIHRSGAIRYGRKLSDQSIYKVVLKRVNEACLSAPATPHDLRRSFVSELLDLGKDMNTVSALAGHASVDTTARYDRREDQVRRDAQSSLHWPTRRSDPTC